MKAVMLAAIVVMTLGSASAFSTATATTPTVDAHSGGTNSAGCHTNSKTGAYHCH